MKKIQKNIDRNDDEWAIALKTEKKNKIIGSIGMHKIKFRNCKLSFDFGYLIDEEYWNKGLCTEAAQKMMHYAFIGLKCDVMTVSHFVNNLRSKRVIEKCKFNFRGIYPKHSSDKPGSKAHYYLTREEYTNLFNLYEKDSKYVISKDLLEKYEKKPIPKMNTTPQNEHRVRMNCA